MKTVFKKTNKELKHTSFIAPFLKIDIATKKRGRMKYLNWDKVRELIKKNPDSKIQVGLLEDWNNTGDMIYNKGEYPYMYYVYTKSTWATPIVIVDKQKYICYSFEETEPIMCDAEVDSLLKAIELWKRNINTNGKPFYISVEVM